MSKIKINDIELEFDTFDVETMARYESALDKAEEMNEEALEDLKTSEKMRRQCHTIFDFFNEVFGEGTDKKLFGDRTNLSQCMEAFDKVITEADNQQAQYSKRFDKYMPKRASRS